MRQLGKVLAVSCDCELLRGVVIPLFLQGGCAFLCVFRMVLLW